MHLFCNAQECMCQPCVGASGAQAGRCVDPAAHVAATQCLFSRSQLARLQRVTLQHQTCMLHKLLCFFVPPVPPAATARNWLCIAHVRYWKQCRG